MLIPLTVPPVCSVSLCPLLSSTVCPRIFSTSHCTTSLLFVTMRTNVFYSLSTNCQYLTLYHLFVLCHYVHSCLLEFVQILPDLTLYHLLVLCHYIHCCLLQSIHCLSISFNVPHVCSVSLYPLLSSTVYPLSVNIFQCTTCLFCVSMSIVVFYSLSTVCQYLTIYHLFVLCRHVHCCLL